MRKFMSGAILGLFILAFAPASARAQNWYELNLHGGALLLDDKIGEDADPMLGARFMLQYESGFAWGGNFDWVLSDVDIDDDGPGEDIDQSLFLYSAEVDYVFPSTSQTRFFVGGGIGAATFKFSDVPEPFEDSSTELLIPLAAGIKYYNNSSPGGSTWAIRADVRDNIILFDDQFDASEGDTDTEATNNFEISGGVSFIF